MQPNSDISFLFERKVSTVNLESISRSTLSNCISLSHCKAKNKPSASPTSTRRKHGCNTVLANTKLPSDSRIHIPIPVRLRELEKVASILHLYRPGIWCYHRVPFCSVDLGGSPLRCDEGDLGVVEAVASRAFASCQSTTMFRAHSTTKALDSVISSNTVVKRCDKPPNKFWSREKITYVADVVVERACWIEPHRPVVFQTSIANRQAKKKNEQNLHILNHN